MLVLLEESIFLAYLGNIGSKPSTVAWHKHNWAKAEAFIESAPQKTLTTYICKLLQLYFPGCAARFQHAIDHWKLQDIYADFGLYFNFCPNFPFPGGWPRVHTKPHADRKSIAGGNCVLMAFLFEKFDFKKRAWLVIWELGLIFEVPIGVALFYPSAVFFHFNIDISDLDLIITDGERPDLLQRDAYSKWDDDEQGRESLVWFNQASMIQVSEIQFDMLKKARENKKSGNTDFGADVEQVFASGLSPSFF
ncbi:hypothetical protein JVT61DRAFT_12419 [Boletus reticuloceps]|uniref:Uncharacterized protein n=1 Tax=Boletus reticuloceps TaxID=495285 RepID=A0A8I2YDV6_9AGAM|nr:hypothetical protein JVT61DRAFT_12419 [Boletus reticuloceps]